MITKIAAAVAAIFARAAGDWRNILSVHVGEAGL